MGTQLCELDLSGKMDTKKIYDVIVVGAGPVGLFLACELGLTNLDNTISILVLERDSLEPSATKSAWTTAPLGYLGFNTTTAEALYRRRMLAWREWFGTLLEARCWRPDILWAVTAGAARSASAAGFDFVGTGADLTGYSVLCDLHDCWTRQVAARLPPHKRRPIRRG